MAALGKAKKVAHAVDNAFERLHPRVKHGAHAGEFEDVPGKMEAMGGVAHKDGVWIVPTKNRKQLDELLAEMNFKVTVIPEGLREATDAERKKWKVPPAWTDVFIAADPEDQKLKGPIVIGFDAKGKKQYKYSDEWQAQQAAKKWARLKHTEAALPEIDKRLNEEAMTNDVAAATMLIRKMGLRVGDTQDTMAKVQAYGATTLQRRHIEVRGDTVHLDFIGKKGVHIDIELEDKQLARTMRHYMKGKRANDDLFPGARGEKVNDWIQESAPELTAKDFRTWHGTSHAKRLVSEMPMPQTQADYQRQRNTVGDEVSKLLGNTRKVALADYVHPAAFNDWENADTVSAAQAKASVDQFSTIEDRLAEVMKYGLDDWPEKGDVATKILGDAPDTQALHSAPTPDGGVRYHAGRAALHDRIVGSTLAGPLRNMLGDHPAVLKLEAGGVLSDEEKADVKHAVTTARGGGLPRALFMAGGPASGKTSVTRNNPELLPDHAVTINPDDLKEALPEYERMVKGRDKFAAAGVHEESSDLGKRLHTEALELGMNVVMDGTGDSVGNKFVDKILAMQRAGYDTRVMYVTVPTDEAVIRATLRAMGSGRWVPTPELRKQHSVVSRNFEGVARIGVPLSLYDTTLPDDNNLVYENGRVVKKGAYDAFVAKGLEEA